MSLEKGVLYWIESSHVIVEYIGPAAGDQHQVKTKETGHIMQVERSDISKLDQEAYNNIMEEFEKQGLTMNDIWTASDAHKENVASKTWSTVFDNFTLSTEENYGEFVEDHFGFDLFPNRPPAVQKAAEGNNTMFWIVGVVGAIFLINYK